MVSLNDLKLQVDAAEYVLRLLQEIGADCTDQIAHCRELRAALNQACPDSEHYDPRDGNIVAKPV